MLEKAVAHSDSGRRKDEVYTVNEIKSLLGVSTSTVYGILRADIFPHTIAYGRYEISKAGFDRWFATLLKDMQECHSYEQGIHFEIGG